MPFFEFGVDHSSDDSTFVLSDHSTISSDGSVIELDSDDSLVKAEELADDDDDDSVICLSPPIQK